MTSDEVEMVPLSEAENEVKVVTQRLALLHLAYARTLVDRFGWDEGKQLVLDSIKEYGRRVAERTERGLQSLPRYGFWESREGQPPACELGKIVLEYGEMDVGSLYCLIDPAKTMHANPEEKLIHLKALTVGDEHCEFDTVPTTEKDKEDFFGESKDWSHVDPRLHKYYKEKESAPHP
jgi:hypothetical protein